MAKRHPCIVIVKPWWMGSDDKELAVLCQMLCTAHAKGTACYEVEPRLGSNHWSVVEVRYRKRKHRTITAYIDIRTTVTAFKLAADDKENTTLR